MNSTPARRGILLTAGTVTAVAALTGAFIAGAHLSGPSDPDVAGPSDNNPFRLASAALAPTASCDALLETYQERALELVGPWGWEWHTPLFGSARMPVAADAAVASENAGAARTSRAVSSTLR